MDVENWIIKKMVPEKWYNVSKGNIDIMKKMFKPMSDINIELTFNKEYTKIKKTVWKNGKPV